MLTRIATGVLLAPLVAWLLLEGPSAAVATVFIVASAICVWELLTMVMPGRRVEQVAGVLTAAGLQTSLYLAPTAILGDLIGLLAVPALVVLARPQPIEGAITRLMTIWGAFVYIVLPFSYGIEIAVNPARELIMMTLALVWAGDTFAYFGGKALGRHKLYPVVSPNKTVEGAVFGLLGSVVAAAVSSLVIPSLSLTEGALIGAAGGAIAQMGDFVESLIKRSAGVKDSGTLLPGHGGLLDRLDGVIFAFPVVAALI